MSKEIKEKSKCCKAPVEVKGIGDFRDGDRVCTMHYECTKCGESCDLYCEEKIKDNNKEYKWDIPKLKKLAGKIVEDEKEFEYLNMVVGLITVIRNDWSEIDKKTFGLVKGFFDGFKEEIILNQEKKLKEELIKKIEKKMETNREEDEYSAGYYNYALKEVINLIKE